MPLFAKAATPGGDLLARLHAVWGLGQVGRKYPEALATVHGLLRDGDPHVRLRQAAAVASVPWLGMWAALLVPGTAASDPEFASTQPKALGLHPQLLVALGLLGGLAGAVLTEEVRARPRVGA